MRKSAIEKYASPSAPVVKTLIDSKGKQYPPGQMLIPTPAAIQALVQRIPAGQVATLSALRQELARRYDAEYTCAMTTGIFLRIVAEAAVEAGTLDSNAGNWGEFLAILRSTPWWRVVRDDGALIDKLPGGVSAQRERLVAEGWKVGGTVARPKVVSDIRWTWPAE
jgi:alkylated DNA nucleotide flippase Atl1